MLHWQSRKESMGSCSTQPFYTWEHCHKDFPGVWRGEGEGEVGGVSQADDTPLCLFLVSCTFATDIIVRIAPFIWAKPRTAKKCSIFLTWFYLLGLPLINPCYRETKARAVKMGIWWKMTSCTYCDSHLAISRQELHCACPSCDQLVSAGKRRGIPHLPDVGLDGSADCQYNAQVAIKKMCLCHDIDDTRRDSAGDDDD